MPLPIVRTRAPIDLAFALRTEAELLESVRGLTLLEAMGRYHALLDGVLRDALGPTQVACASGCSTCCHQPLVVSFLELASVVLSDEARFEGVPFRSGVKGATDRLSQHRKDGADSTTKLLHASFAAREPCLFLGPGGACSVYEHRPFLCRNAFSTVTCTFEAFEPGGFGDLGALARRLREALHRTWRLDRFDTGRIKTSNAGFFLPDGLAWLRNEVDRKQLRRVFREERPLA